MALLGQTKGPSNPVSCLPTVASRGCPRGNERTGNHQVIHPLSLIPSFWQTEARDTIPAHRGEYTLMDLSSMNLSSSFLKAKKPHIIGEALILPTASTEKIMGGETKANKFKAIQLSNNTVKRGIEVIAADQKCTLVEHLKNTDAFTLQVDVSTESRDAHFLAFVKYTREGAILEEFLFCLPLPGHKTAQEIFNVLHVRLQYLV
ncbi:unnamed protein product [Caretta caretta]